MNQNALFVQLDARVIEKRNKNISRVCKRFLHEMQSYQEEYSQELKSSKKIHSRFQKKWPRVQDKTLASTG
jgi:hypothetical protein